MFRKPLKKLRICERQVAVSKSFEEEKYLDIGSLNQENMAEFWKQHKVGVSGLAAA